MFWRKNKTEIAEKKLEVINTQLQKSFANVKKDTHNIFQWLNYFYRKSLEQEATIKRMQLELSYVPKTREEIRKIIDDYYSFESIMARIRDINDKVETLSKKSEQPIQQIQHIVPAATAPVVQVQPSLEVEGEIEGIYERLEKLEQRKHSMKEKILKKITKNSKDYVKSVMMSYIRKYERISALQLKEIIVDEQAFCSKSSFYRLLEEIEGSEEIAVIKEGKEKHYLLKGVSHMSE